MTISDYSTDTSELASCKVDARLTDIEESRIKLSAHAVDSVTNVRLKAVILENHTYEKSIKDNRKYCKQFKESKEFELQAIREKDFLSPQQQLEIGDRIRGYISVTPQSKDKISKVEKLKE